MVVSSRLDVAYREANMRLQMKRAYEPPKTADGYRVLIDRLWPRGIGKEKLRLDEWAKELAPSTDLRRWFGHDVEKWPEFRRRYREELRTGEARDKLREIARRALSENVTLVYSAKDEEHNDAVVLKELIETEVKRASRRASQPDKRSARTRRSKAERPTRRA